MNESITSSAGASFGQEVDPKTMEKLIRAQGRVPVQRTTLYGQPQPSQVGVWLWVRVAFSLIIGVGQKNRKRAYSELGDTRAFL
jgi:hypothetical protein